MSSYSPALEPFGIRKIMQPSIPNLHNRVTHEKDRRILGNRFTIYFLCLSDHSGGHIVLVVSFLLTMNSLQVTCWRWPAAYPLSSLSLSVCFLVTRARKTQLCREFDGSAVPLPLFGTLRILVSTFLLFWWRRQMSVGAPAFLVADFLTPKKI